MKTKHQNKMKTKHKNMYTIRVHSGKKLIATCKINANNKRHARKLFLS